MELTIIRPPFTAVKRIMREACELQTATDHYWARPLEDNLFEWHFTVRGPSGTDFDGGLYHGRILLPPEYPMKPPNIILLTVCFTRYMFTPNLSPISSHSTADAISHFQTNILN